MKATGIIRRIDELGRIVIPKEIRKSMRIRNGESLEIYIIEDNSIVLKKYSLFDNLETIATSYVDSIYGSVKQNIIITDTNKVIACAGPLKKKYLNKNISESIYKFIERRDSFVERHKKEITVIEGESIEAVYSFSSIIVNGDAIGSVIILSTDKELDILEEKTTIIAAEFLSKQVS